MANPFYVEPASPMQGLGAIMAGLEKREENQKRQQALEAAKAAIASNDPEQLALFAAQHPEYAQAAQMAYRTMQDRQKAQAAQAQQESLQQGFELFQGGDIKAYQKWAISNPEASEQIVKVISSGNDALKAKQLDLAKGIITGTISPDAGINQYATILDQIGMDSTAARELAGKGPDEIKAQAEKLFAALDPVSYGKWQEAKQKTPEAIAQKEAGELTAGQKEYEAAKKDGFKGSFIDFKQAISGEGPKTQLEMMKLQVQIRDIQDRQADREDTKRLNAERSDKKIKNLVSGIDNVLGEIGKAKTEAKSFMATGAAGAVSGSIPSTPAYNLRKRINTVKANIGFDKLQAMREASPTGGALGQVAVQELDALQSSIAALDPNMGDEELIESLNSVEKHYRNWKKTLIGEAPVDTPDLAAAARAELARRRGQNAR